MELALEAEIVRYYPSSERRKLIVQSRSQFGSETFRRFAVKGDRVHTGKLEARICEAKMLVLEMEEKCMRS